MNIDYFNPFSKAWERMTNALFRPFDIGKWFALGFTAFLSQLLDGGFNGWTFPGSSNRGGGTNMPDIGRIPERTADWIHSHPLLVAVILMGVFIFLAIILFLTWLSSRGAFMFLDNVVHNRALVAKPWREYKIQGDSLFLWRVGFGIVVTLLMLASLVVFLILIVYAARGYNIPQNIAGIIIIGLLWLLGSLIAGYISLFTYSFVVPIMYRHNMRILQAWRKFLPILKSHFIYFILYGLLFFLLIIVIGIAAFLTGCLTCCIAFIIMSIPYIGSVFLLPVSFTLRAFSLEFLAQWGADYSVFYDESSYSDDVPPPPVPPPPLPSPSGVNGSGI